jgi:universal stress protein A
MIELKRILVPTDFSENSAQAVRYGCALCEQFDSELHLLHVVSDVTSQLPAFGLGLDFPDVAEHERHMQSAARVSLADAIDAEWRNQHRVVDAVLLGRDFVEIVRYARQNDIDLIVLGTHGRTGLSHVLLGSVAEKIVRKAPCPVLTVRMGEHEFVMP